MLAVVDAEDAATPPRIHEMELVGMPSDFNFRPHGMFLDNATQRLFVVSHGDANDEESIPIFAIEAARGQRVPWLRFLYALTSPKIPYYNASFYWFLNELALARRTDGSEELYASQFGPYGGPLKEFGLWRCTWDGGAAPIRGRMPANCELALSFPSGINGVAISNDGRRLWLNDLWGKVLRAVERDPDSGALTRREDDDLLLPTYADNIEYDHATGDLHIGDVGNLDLDPFAYRNDGGLLVARRGATKFSGGYALSYGMRAKSSPAMSDYVVSAAVKFGRWVLIGSPFNEGLAICKGDEDAAAAAGGAKLEL
jgi:hypothetical protein